MSKTALKKSIFPNSTFFEDMGFTYMGPVDGHDVQKLTDMLTWARELRCPVLLHVQTAKGRGCRFGGAGSRPVPRRRAVRSADSGKELKAAVSAVIFRRVRYGADGAGPRGQPSVCAITAAMEYGTGLNRFAEALPDRFFDVGIAEGHAVAMAAGMAKQGMTPGVGGVFDAFCSASFDMLLHDVALDSSCMWCSAVDRAGLVGEDGETHHGMLRRADICRWCRG